MAKDIIKQHARPPAAQSPTPERLLYTREQVAQLLGGVSTATVRRMEAAGVLRTRRLIGSNNGKVFIPAEDVLAVVNGKAAEHV